jgi:hypothetical protein
VVRVAQLIAAVVTPHRFRSKRQFCSYCGLAVVTRSSADYEVAGARLRPTKKVVGGGTGSSCAAKLSRYRLMASLIFSTACSLVSPYEMQPGNDGTSATNMPSSSCSSKTRYFIYNLRLHCP